MQTSLRGIADKAARHKKYRFRDLFGMLNEEYLMSCWSFLNPKASPGVDQVDAREYGKNLAGNVGGLVDVVKRGSYRARLVLRKYIPKINGKMRPLGIPAIADKLLQTGVYRILESIYEADFLSCSYGYRQGRGPHDAIRDLSAALMAGRCKFIVEADIKGFFDNISHEWLRRMLELRIDDKPFLRLIRKWLKAGVLDKGEVIKPEAGTPQGGSVSPILANVYLHYALDIWFEKVVKVHCRGRSALWRYADDFVCAFEFKEDAERFYQELGPRLKKFELELAEDKTNLIRFIPEGNRGPKPSFDFLSFEFRWGLSRWGKPTLKRRTSRKKYRASLANFRVWSKENRNLPLRLLFGKLNSKLRGYYNYYGLRYNSKSLWDFLYQAERIFFKWMNRRSQRKSYNWKGFKQLLEEFKVPRPRIAADF